MASVFRFGVVVTASLALMACAVGPDYRRPQPLAPAGWSAPVPHGGSAARLIDWWERFDDPVLTRLLRTAEADSPSLVVAWANIVKARATLTGSRADALPSLTAQGSAQRSNQSGQSGQSGQTGGGSASSVGTTLTGGLDAAWEVDLFGKLRRTSEADEARLQARTDDWHDARVSLAAEVADSYVQYRACRLLERAYADESRSQTDTARATATAVRAGFTSPIDGALARASAASLRSTLTQQQADCDVLVKALVALTGDDEAAMRRQLEQGAPALPKPAAFAVDSLPAALIAQRPDLASLERELAAAGAEIGVAEADRYPSLSFSGSISRTGLGLGSLMTTWLLGPTLSLPLFDGGKRAAAVESAQASYDAQSAQYRNGLRTALKEVEQALVRLDAATRRAGDAETAAQGYRDYFEAIDRNWRAGGASLLDREEARRNALSAEIDLITVQRDQIQQWIALYKALGGGWQPEAPAKAPATADGNAS